MKPISHLIISLTLLILTSMIACTRHPSFDNQQNTPNPKPALGKPAEGTVDGGGGGNKICGRPIDAFRKDIKELPEYKKYIDPILQYFNSSSFQGCQNCQAHNFALGAYMAHAVFDKGWYIVPCPIDQISKEKVGSIYETEQVAIQTFDDIWIDQEKFNSLSEEDRGMMLLHEIVMGIKILKFDNTMNQCKTTAPEESFCSGIRVKPRKNLNDITPTDYKDVRIVTNELFQNYQKYDIRSTDSNSTINENLSSNELLRKYNFSNEYHIWRRKDSDVPLITGERLIGALSRSKLTNDMPKYTKYKALDKFTFVAGSTCDMDYSYDEANKKLSLKFKTTSLDGKVIETELQKDFNLAKDTTLKGYYIDSLKNGQLDSFTEYTLPLEFADHLDSTLKMGEHSIKVFLEFDTAKLLNVWEVMETVCTSELNGKCSGSSSVNDSKISQRCTKEEKVILDSEPSKN